MNHRILLHQGHDHGAHHHQEHTHEGGGDHSHEHSHPHSHEADTPDDAKAELIALMRYMVNHNAAHMTEISELSEKLKEAFGDEAYDKVINAVSEFEKGNKLLSEALSMIS